MSFSTTFPSVRCPTRCYSNVPSALFSTSFFSKCNPLTRHYHFIKRMTSKSFIKVPSSLHLRKHKAIFCWQSQHLEILSFLTFILNHFHSQRNDILFTICKILSTCSHNDPDLYKSIGLTRNARRCKNCHMPTKCTLKFD